MGYKCAVVGCRTGYEGGEKQSTFFFPTDLNLKEKWIKFVNRKEWSPTKYSVICAKHFDKELIKEGKKSKLRWELQPVPTIHDDPSMCVVPPIPRKPPKERNIYPDEFSDFKLNDAIDNFNTISEDFCPKDFTFFKEEKFILMYRLRIDEKTKIPLIHESILVDDSLHVSLSYLGYHVPLPDWFRSVHDCKLSKKSVLENFPRYLRSKGEEMNPILKELGDIQHYKPQGRPPYSSELIRYALLLRYTSYQSYKLLLEKLPLPSISLLKKLQKGDVDVLKCAEILLENGRICSDCVLMVDEMYLKKSSQYHGGNYVGEDENGDLYKGIVVFMIVGLMKSIPYVVKSCPVVSISGEWLSGEIDLCIFNLQKSGFKVRAVVSDNHSSNVNAFADLKKQYGEENSLFINHPAYGSSLKTYLLYDMVHIIKNVRNNLLNSKKFVFPPFKFDSFGDKISVRDGYISWSMFHKLYENDLKLEANLKKAHKITFQVTHPGNNKQNVSHALAIFHETTSAAILSHYPERDDAAAFLQLFDKLFLVCNSKQQFHSANRLGNAAISGDKKPEFLTAVANWVELWSSCPYFTLSPQTSKAIITSLKCQAMLIEDLLSEGYKYVITSRFQSDPLERHFSKYRQMNGGNFLVSLREVNNSEKILKIRSLIKEDIDIFGENVFSQTNEERKEEFRDKLLSMYVDIMESQLSEESYQVAYTIAGYVAKRICEKVDCQLCKNKLISSGNDYGTEFLDILTRGGLTYPSQSLADFVAQGFSSLDIASPLIIQYASYLPTKMLSEEILDSLAEHVYFSCEEHAKKVKRIAISIIVNVFFNNKQKIATDNVRKQQVIGFKARQRSKR